MLFTKHVTDVTNVVGSAIEHDLLIGKRPLHHLSEAGIHRGMLGAVTQGLYN